MAINNYRYPICLLTLMILPAEWGIAKEVSIDGELEQSVAADWNFNLDEDDEEALLTLESTVELAITYEMSKDTLAYLSLGYGRELEIEEENRERTYASTLKVNEGFVELNDINGIDNLIKKISLTVGRFNVSDKREWYYDKSLDGIMISFEYEPIDTEFSLSINREELFGSDLLRNDNYDPVNNFIVAAEHEPFENIDIEFAAYTIVRHDRSTDNQSPIFYGLSSNGELADKRFNFWTDIAWARGDDDDEKIRGYGLDVGATMFFQKDGGPYVTLSYAFGSGDGDKDSDFRQTDLQGNSDKFGGVTSFKYYGELLDPELSNLHIFTAGIGYRFSSTASLDFVFHHYRQDEALDRLRSNDLDTDPDGVNKELGIELDMIFGFNLSSNIETELVLGYFQPGPAFDDNADDAFMVDAKLSYKF